MSRFELGTSFHERLIRHPDDTDSTNGLASADSQAGKDHKADEENVKPIEVDLTAMQDAAKDWIGINSVHDPELQIEDLGYIDVGNSLNSKAQVFVLSKEGLRIKLVTNGIYKIFLRQSFEQTNSGNEARILKTLITGVKDVKATVAHLGDLARLELHELDQPMYSLVVVSGIVTSLPEDPAPQPEAVADEKKKSFVRKAVDTGKKVASAGRKIVYDGSSIMSATFNKNFVMQRVVIGPDDILDYNYGDTALFVPPTEKEMRYYTGAASFQTMQRVQVINPKLPYDEAMRTAINEANALIKHQ